MKSRQAIIDKFSTFVQFMDEHFHRWAIAPSLRRSMQRELLRAAESGELKPRTQGVDSEDTHQDESFWGLYWYRQWNRDTADTLTGLAEGHLSSYLQETCYWATHRLVLNQAEGMSQLPDHFQMAIATLPKLLRGYDPAQGASLKTYAALGFTNAIRDGLRRQQTARGRSDWGLLRKISQKCLLEALQQSGQSPEKVDQYRLAWTCFKTLHVPMNTTRVLDTPDAKTWEAIAQLYQQQARQDSPTATHSAINPDVLERWLKECAKQVRAYLCPPVTSLNIRKFEDGSGEWQDDLPDQSAQTPMMTLMVEEEIQERQAQKLQITQVLSAALEKLAPPMQQLLTLYYGQKLTQQQIAQQLDMKQYTISRRLSSSKEGLLKAIAQWSQETLHIQLTSPVVQQMSIVLEEWLQSHYGSERISSQEGNR